MVPVYSVIIAVVMSFFWCPSIHFFFLVEVVLWHSAKQQILVFWVMCLHSKFFLITDLLAFGADLLSKTVKQLQPQVLVANTFFSALISVLTPFIIFFRYSSFLHRFFTPTSCCQWWQQEQSRNNEDNSFLDEAFLLHAWWKHSFFCFHRCASSCLHRRALLSNFHRRKGSLRRSTKHLFF